MKQFDNMVLIHKHLTGQLSSEEKQAYEAWLLDNENQSNVEEISQVWSKTAAYEPTSFEPNATAAYHKFKNSIEKESAPSTKVIRLHPLRWVARIAAGLVFVISALFLFQSDLINGDKYEAPIVASSILQHGLSDGSNVVLAENASLEVDNRFGEQTRKVKLEGKAFFDIQRNESLPFIIKMGKSELEVLGTSFNVNVVGQISTVEVKSGVVEVRAKTKTEKLTVGQKAVVNFEKDEIELNKTEQSAFNWTKSVLSVESVSVVQLFDELEKYYNVNIELNPNVDQSCTLTSPLAGNSSIDQIFDVLKETYDLIYEKQSNDRYEIKFLSCK